MKPPLRSFIGPGVGALLVLAFAVSLPQRGPVNGSPELPDAPALFAKRCASCHGKDGKANTFKARFNRARNLTNSEWQTSVTDERLFNSISNGRGRMPAYGRKLSEPEVNLLVVYIRQLKN